MEKPIFKLPKGSKGKTKKRKKMEARLVLFAIVVKIPDIQQSSVDSKMWIVGTVASEAT